MSATRFVRRSFKAGAYWRGWRIVAVNDDPVWGMTLTVEDGAGQLRRVHP